MVRFKRCLVYTWICLLMVHFDGSTNLEDEASALPSENSQEAPVGSDDNGAVPESPTLDDSQDGQTQGMKTEETFRKPPKRTLDSVDEGTQATDSVPSAATKEELESGTATDAVPEEENSGQRNAEETIEQQTACVGCETVVSQENAANENAGEMTQQKDVGAPAAAETAKTKDDSQEKDTDAEDTAKPVTEKPEGPPVKTADSQEPSRPTIQEAPATPSGGDAKQQPEEAVKEAPAKTETKPSGEKPTSEPEEPDTKTEVVEPEEDINLPKQEKDLLSFEEFKKKMMTEMAEKENLQQLEASHVPTNGGSGSSVRSSKSRVNYASVSCGAKVLGSNSEAQSSSAILTENKDQYMIQPCKARKWFMVELCEPVQVSSLEIGNLELFSSIPKSFVVQLSDRHPVKEWRTLGTFHARDERSIQMFAVSEQQERYSKYIRIEMQSHYGTEHYCPLSLLRVYGATADDYFDDHNEEIVDELIPEQDTPDNTETAMGETDERDKPTNLFTSAKDTVITLVKNVWSPGDDSEPKVENVTNDIVTLNATAQNQSSINASSIAKDEKSVTDMKPCTPVPSTDQKSGEGPVVGQMQPETPEVSTEQRPRTDGVPCGPGYPSAPDAQVLKPPQETLTRPPLVTLLESGGTVLADVLSRCDFHDPPSMDSRTTCGYYKVMAYVFRGTCQLGRFRDPILPASETATQLPPGKKNITMKTGASGKKTTQTKPVGGTKPTETINDKSEEDLSASIKPTPTQAAADTPQTEQEVKPSFTQSSSSHEVKPDVTPSIQPKETVSAEVKPSSSSSSCEKSVDASCQMGPDTAHIRPTQSSTESPPVATQAPATTPKVEEQQQLAEQPSVPPPSKTESERDTAPEQPTAKEPTGDQPVAAHSGANVNIYAENDEAEMVAPEQVNDDIPITKISSSKKQLKFMELNNRLHALELNLNLSSRYLEDLSQRYRRQMEEMYRSLNKTIGKLTNTSRAAAERDVRQQDNIADLQKQIDRLTFNMDKMETSMLNVHREVIERHLYLMCVEVFVIAMVIAWCLSRQRQVTQRRLQDYNVSQIPFRAKASSSNHSIQQPPDRKKKAHRRRNSVDATPPRPPRPPEVLGAQRSLDDLDLFCSGSDNSINIVKPGISVFLNDKPNNLDLDCPKKKKRKKHQKQSSYGGTSSTKQTSAESDEAFRNEGSVAGLLFAPYSHQSVSSTNLSRDANDFRRKSDEFTGNNTHSSSDSISGGKNRKLTARRSLDLITTCSKNKPQGQMKVKANGVNGKDSTRRCPPTNIYASHMNGHSSMNGSISNGGVHNGSSQTNINGTWKNWFPGIRK